MDLEQLVERIGAGEEAAWRRFLAEYGRLLYSIPATLGLDENDRDEVFQNACLTVFRSIHTLRDPAKLASWLYGVTYRLAIDALRRKRRDARVGGDPGEDWTAIRDEDPGPDERLGSLEETALLLEGLDRLDGRCRRMLRSLYLDDPPASYADVSRDLEMPLGSVGPTRARCLEKLRKILEGVFNPEGGTTNG